MQTDPNKPHVQPIRLKNGTIDLTCKFCGQVFANVSNEKAMFFGIATAIGHVCSDKRKEGPEKFHWEKEF